MCYNNVSSIEPPNLRKTMINMVASTTIAYQMKKMNVFIEPKFRLNGNAPPTPCSAGFYSYNNGNNNDVALIIVVSTINVVSIIIVVTNVSYPPLES